MHCKRKHHGSVNLKRRRLNLKTIWSQAWCKRDRKSTMPCRQRHRNRNEQRSNGTLFQRAQDRALAFVMSQHKRLGTECSAGFQMIHHSDLLRRILTLSNPSEGAMTWKRCENFDRNLMCSISAHRIPIDCHFGDPAYMTCRQCLEGMLEEPMF